MTAMKNKTADLPAMHYTAGYLITPAHPVTINLIGVGGTGSQVLNSLARMHSALKALGHPGLYVRAIDPDKVTDANMGRQLFSPADIDGYKCEVLVGRINRFFGTDWEAVPVLFDAACPTANITISCVDSGKARKEIFAILDMNTDKKKRSRAGKLNENGNMSGYGYYEDRLRQQPYERPYYWMDFGNMQDRGQVVIGTLNPAEQPKSEEFRTITTLPKIHQIHKDIFRNSKNDDQGPSCSLAEALQKQDLFINTNLANAGLALLWKMFREARIQYHGLYLNMQTMTANPIKVK